MMKKVAAFMVIGLVAMSPVFLYGQETPASAEATAGKPAEKKMTEGEFAVQLVRMMKLQRLLPPAPLAEDCIEALEQFGITSLIGWDQNRELSRENYVVIMAMAAGKEEVVHEKAQEACDRNVEIINSRWQLKHDLEDKRVSLEELFKDEVYFPKGAPLCPYRRAYRDKDKNNKVDLHNHFGRRILKKLVKEKK